MAFTITGTITEDMDQMRDRGRGHCIMDIDKPYPHRIDLTIKGSDDRSIPTFLDGIVDGRKVTVIAELDRFSELETTLEGITPASE